MEIEGGGVCGFQDAAQYPRFLFSSASVGSGVINGVRCVSLTLFLVSCASQPGQPEPDYLKTEKLVKECSAYDAARAFLLVVERDCRIRLATDTQIARNIGQQNVRDFSEIIAPSPPDVNDAYTSKLSTGVAGNDLPHLRGWFECLRQDMKETVQPIFADAPRAYPVYESYLSAQEDRRDKLMNKQISYGELNRLWKDSWVQAMEGIGQLQRQEGCTR